MKISRVLVKVLVVWMVLTGVWFARLKVADYNYQTVTVTRQMYEKDMRINELKTELDKIKGERNFICKDVNLAFMQNKVER